MAGSIATTEVPSVLAISSDTRPVDGAADSRLPATDARRPNPSETAVPEEAFRAFDIGSAFTEQA